MSEALIKERRSMRSAQAMSDELLPKGAQERPCDMQSRLEDLLMKLVVQPSLKRGLLGEASKLRLTGDGTIVESGGNQRGRKVCWCDERCSCPRTYSDPDAEVTYDNHRKRYVFGHMLYEMVCPTNKRDLPVHLTIGPASERDFTLSIKSLDRFLKTLASHEPDAVVEYFIGDKHHDSKGNHEYLSAKNIKAIIPFSRRNGTPAPTGTAKEMSKRGIPLCEAGVEMSERAAILSRTA